MELDREWFEIFFEILPWFCVPAGIFYIGSALIVFGSEDKQFAKWPRNGDEVLAAIFRVLESLVLFGCFLVYFFPAAGSWSKVILAPLVVTSMAYLLLLIFTVVFWRRVHEEAYWAVWWLAAPPSAYLVIYALILIF